MLEKFQQAKQAEIEALLKLAANGSLPDPLIIARPSLSRALREKGPGAVIAEYKRASPSKGLINPDWLPEQAASGYALAGAAALSVLTEQTHFQGRLKYLEAMTGPGLPLLRKDFLLHPLQIRQSATTPASAVLLIVRMLKPDEFGAMLAACAKYGLEAVVEVFDRADLDRAKQVGARIIQVNNRDLATLSTDLTVSLELIRRKSADEIWISASGLETARDMAKMRDAGFDALLMGSRMMRTPDPGAALARLLERMQSESHGA